MKWKIFLFLALFAGENAILSQITIVSWNIRDFGQSRDDQEINSIAEVIKNADIVAIQEVVAKHPGGAKAVARLVDQLDRLGSNWDYCISDPTNSPSSYISERYAFLWKSSKITKIGKAFLASAIDEDVYREPYVGKFKANGKIFTLINYHSRTHQIGHDYELIEINAISHYLESQNFENAIWLGDFNLNYDNIAFSYIKKLGFKQTLQEEKTTLKLICTNGEYLSRAEDNMIYKLRDFKIESSGVIDFVKGKNCNLLREFNLIYSDHLPIYLKVN